MYKSTNAKPLSASRELHVNTENGPVLHSIDISHQDYIAVIDPDTAFWSLITKDKFGNIFDQKSHF